MKTKDKEMVALCNIYLLETGETVPEGQKFTVSSDKAKELINSNLAIESNAN